jgi:hypothetical protein
MPINPEDVIVDRASNESLGLNPSNITKDSEKSWKYVSEMVGTLKNIGKVYPAFETAANIATSTYGVPISGLVGLAALPFGADAANSAIEAVQKFMVYQPQTEGGQQRTNAVNVPLQKLDELGGKAGGMAKDPITATAIHTLISASPALMGLPKAPKIQGNFVNTVQQGINKGVRPSVSKKELWGQREKYMQNAGIAVDEVINNKQNLKLTDREGNVKHGELPKTLEEFSQAIEQTKRAIYSEYDGLSKSADAQGAAVNMGPVISELRAITENKVLQTIDPGTISYARSRMDALVKPPIKDSAMIEPKSFSTQESQQMVQILNQSEKAFYANPTPELKGKAYVDSLIANNLRAGLDAAIEGATDTAYQPLKNKYGALRMLETDVTKRAIVDGRKNIVGLIDFSDIFSSSQLMQGLLAQQPALIASGMTIKGMSAWFKKRNDPNYIISKMFEKVDKSKTIIPKERLTFTPGVVAGSMAGETEQER